MLPLSQRVADVLGERYEDFPERVSWQAMSRIFRPKLSKGCGSWYVLPGRQWEKITFATTPEFETPLRIEIDERAQGWYQLAGNFRYLYTAKPTPGQGSWYASSFRDGTGAFLHGGKIPGKGCQPV